MFIVECGTPAWFLRGTTWSGDLGRAQKFATREAAEIAIAKAKNFMKLSLRNKTRIVDVGAEK